MTSQHLLESIETLERQLAEAKLREDNATYIVRQQAATIAELQQQLADAEAHIQRLEVRGVVA